MTRHLLPVLIGCTVIISSFSCKKGESNPNKFYGYWKASYGDTVTFAHQNGRNVLIYDVSGSPGGPEPGFTNDHEFDYHNGKFYIRQGIGTSSNFMEVPSFAWVKVGKEFTVEKREWLYFISSVGKFTFTKIQ
jgi:hypothetical protein